MANVLYTFEQASAEDKEAEFFTSLAAGKLELTPYTNVILLLLSPEALEGSKY
jgi:hypothetical protein